MTDRNRDSRPDFDASSYSYGDDYEHVEFLDRTPLDPERDRLRDHRGPPQGPYAGTRDFLNYGALDRGWSGYHDPPEHSRAARDVWPSHELADRSGLSPYMRYPYGISGRDWSHGRFVGRGPKGYRRSDERIREEVSDRLMAHPDIDASDIEVQATNGVVLLSGTVEDRHEKRMAEHLAEASLGVNDVDNQLKVRHGFWANFTGEKVHERELHREPNRDSITKVESDALADTKRG